MELYSEIRRVARVEGLSVNALAKRFRCIDGPSGRLWRLRSRRSERFRSGGLRNSARSSR